MRQQLQPNRKASSHITAPFSLLPYGKPRYDIQQIQYISLQRQVVLSLLHLSQQFISPPFPLKQSRLGEKVIPVKQRGICSPGIFKIEHEQPSLLHKHVPRRKIRMVKCKIHFATGILRQHPLYHRRDQGAGILRQPMQMLLQGEQSLIIIRLLLLRLLYRTLLSKAFIEIR